MGWRSDAYNRREFSNFKHEIEMQTEAWWGLGALHKVSCDTARNNRKEAAKYWPA